MKTTDQENWSAPEIPGDMPDWVPDVWFRKVVQGQGSFEDYAAQHHVNRKTVQLHVHRWGRYINRLQESMGGEAMAAYRARLEYVLGAASVGFETAEHDLAKVGYLRTITDAAEKLAVTYGIRTSPVKPKVDEQKVPVKTMLVTGRPVRNQRVTVGEN